MQAVPSTLASATRRNGTMSPASAPCPARARTPRALAWLAPVVTVPLSLVAVTGGSARVASAHALSSSAESSNGFGMPQRSSAQAAK